jgi:Zn-finger nucleic acid-binding protein
MNCPVCQKTLREVVVDEIVVDVCERGCGGIWFDRFELQKVDEPHECTGEKLLNVEKDETITVDHTKRRYCPKCGDIIMMRHFFSAKREVEVDECPKCAGVWLDSGELGIIRHQYGTEDERKKAAGKVFSDIFGVELDKMRAESEEKAEKAKKIRRLFRFLCPSNYLLK